MVVDTSALVAIFLGEPEADRFDEAIAKASSRLLPATCLLEARIVLIARRDERAVNDLDLWLIKAGVEVAPVDANLVDLATQAWLAYGKGRHPAALNFADCLSYAAAKRWGEPLLCKGDDFSRTGIPLVSA
jgi:ribonuclease VapC